MEGPPTRFGRYRLIDPSSPMGEGGMGVVYRAQNEQTLEQVALKTIRIPTRPLLWCIRHEIHGLSQIQHPGVIRILDHGYEHGYPWYAMELIEGMTLDSYLDTIWPERNRHLSSGDGIFNFLEPTRRLTNGATPPSSGVEGRDPGEAPSVEEEARIAQTSTPLPPEDRPPAAGGQLTSILTLVRHVCVTLAHIHGNGLVHLDLKPTNVFIRRDWTPVIFDFSLVSGVNMIGREDLRPGQSAQGTLGYMAPEQFRGEVLDARTDLYSLGCLLYECITGQLPFLADTLREIRHAHQNVEPIPPSMLVTGVHPDLEKVVLRLLAKRPRDRVGNANDVARVLQKLGALNVEWGSTPPAKDYLYRPEFVGRQSAMLWLEKHLNSLLVGQGGCIFVGAESGVGKTRLMMEFTRVCESRNVRVIAGHCEATGKGGRGSSSGPRLPSLEPFKQLLQAISDHCLEKGEGESDRVLGARGKILVQYEPTFADLPGQQKYEDPPNVPPDADRHRVLHALGDTLAAFAADTPIVAILDDLQWFDELSLAFITLFQGEAFGRIRVLLAGTYRTDEIPRVLSLVLGRSPTERLMELACLDESEVGQIVAGMLGLSEPGEPLARFLTRRSGGNPFFVAEYLRLAVAEKILWRNEEGRWQMADKSEGVLDAIHKILPLPRSLRDLVVRRLDGLSEASQKLLQLASLLGQEFDAALLDASLVLDGSTVLEAIGDLIRRQILEELSGGRLRFVHETLREVTYDRLFQERRQEFHRRVADAIEKLHRDSSGFHRHYSQLAHHWDEGRVENKALAYLDKAGERAIQSGAFDQAYSFFQRALAIEAEAGDRLNRGVSKIEKARWYRRLAECCLAQGKLGESRNHIERSLELLRCPFPRYPWSLGLALGLQIARQTVHCLAPDRYARRKLGNGEAILEAAAAYHHLHQVLCYNSTLSQLLYAAVRSVNLAERSGSSSEKARACASICGILAVVPYHRRLAETYSRKGVLALDGADSSVKTWVHLMDAVYRLVHCEWNRCRHSLEAAGSMARELGVSRVLEEVGCVVATTRLLTGAIDEAIEKAHEVYESALRGDQQTQALGLLLAGQGLYILGRREKLRETLGKIASLVESSPGSSIEAWYHALLALAKLTDKDREGTLNELNLALGFLRRGSSVVWCRVLTHGCLSMACARLLGNVEGDLLPKDGLRVLDASKRVLRVLRRSAKTVPACMPQTIRLDASVSWCRGLGKRAMERWQNGAEMASKLAMPYDEACAWSALGLHLPEESEERRRCLERAESLLESICESGPTLEETRMSLGRPT